MASMLVVMGENSVPHYKSRGEAQTWSFPELALTLSALLS